MAQGMLPLNAIYRIGLKSRMKLEGKGKEEVKKLVNKFNNITAVGGNIRRETVP